MNTITYHVSRTAKPTFFSRISLCKRLITLFLTAAKAHNRLKHSSALAYGVVLVFFLLFSSLSFGQVTVIDPNGDGGFESGATFAANNWSVTTSTAGSGNRNRWICEDDAVAGFSGNRCAYVSNDFNAFGGYDHTYNTGNSRVTHLYRDVTIPAGATNILLDFRWISNGEIYWGTVYDAMRVWLVPTSYNPVYNTQIPNGGGRLQVGLADYYNQNSWTNATNIAIPNTYAGTTFRLVFEWRNDANSGSQPPAGVDNVYLRYTNPTPTITTVNPNNACAGSNTPITITGTNFTNVTGVTINGAAVAAANYTVNNSTQIEAILPAGATTGVGTVVVTTTSGSANATFTVNPSPAAIGGGAATVCTSESTPAFTNAVAGGTWSVTNGTGSASINASGVVTGNTAGTVAVVYTLNPGSCSVTRNITVLGTPGAIGGGTSTICEGESTPAFTNAVAGGTWSITNGTGSATINASGVVTGTNAGTVTVVYTVGDCTPATRELTINASPIITLSSGTANQTVCINTPITTINYTVGGAATGASVTGLPAGLNGVYASGVFAISGTPTVSGTFNYTVTTSGGSCTDASATGTIIVDALPTITLTSAITTTNQNLCANSSIDTITYTVGGSATGVTVTGLPSGVTGIYNAGVFTISGTPSQFGTFNYTVTTTGGTCAAATATGTIIVANDTISPVITSCPVPNALYYTNAGQCHATLSFVATATDNCSTPTITYSVGGTPITFPYNFPVGTTTVTVTATDNSSNTATCNFNVTVQDNQVPVAVCQNISVSLSAGGEVIITPSQIDNGSSDNCGITNMSLSKTRFTCDDLGANTVTLTVTDASGNTASCNAVVTVVDAVDASGASVNISASNTTICEDGSITFTATPVNTGAINYTWYVNGTPYGPITANTFTLTDYATLTPGTYEVYVVMISNLPTCFSPIIESSRMNFTVNPLPVVTAPANVCAGNTAMLSPTTGGTWSSSNPAVATVTNAGVITGVSAGTVTFTYTNTATGCSATTNTVVINALPTVSAPATLCIGSTNTLSPTVGGTWSSSNPAIATVNNAGVVTGVAPGNVTFTFTNANGCSRTTSSMEVLVSPNIISVTASNNPVCAGNPSILTANVQGILGNPVTLVNYNFNSGNSYANLDDQNIFGVAGAVSDNNLGFNNPNSGTATGAQAFTQNTTAGRALQQIDDSRNNDAGYWQFTLNGANLPNYQDFRIYFQTRRTNTNGSDKTIQVQYRRNSTGGWQNLSTVNLYNNNDNWQEVLLSLPAGVNNPTSLQFRLNVSDGYNSNSNRPDVLIDNFQVQGATIGGNFMYSWAANTGANGGLPNGAGTPSANNSQITVNPEVTTQYTVTVTNAAGCPSTQTVIVNVYPTPEIMITADYCPTDNPATPQNEANMVQLIASSNIPVTNWVWNTGQTGNSIYVDIAGYYQVIGTSTNGCPGSASINVAQELVVNGDFSEGNTGFETDYTYRADINGAQLVPANQGELYDDSIGATWVNGYSITNNAHNVHINFWGRDHTQNAVGPQNFMVVNGHGTQYVVWRQTVTVEANTTYYFSAWGMSLNNAGPFARLQFRVNGVPHGSILALGSHAENDNQASDNWQRFWGTWDTGAMEGDILIEIINLEPSFGGNDFGIDDISFATLSTFINLTSDVDTDNQTVCQNTPITNITYDIGGGLTPPAITGLPAGLTTTYNGLAYTISGTPTEYGVFNYTIETGSDCGEPKTATGTITVQQAPTVAVNTVTSPVCYNDGFVTVSATFGGSAIAGAWTGGTGNFQNITTTGNTVTAQYHFGLNETGNVILTFTANAPSGSICAAASEAATVVITPYYIANAGSNIDYSAQACDNLTVNLNANNVAGQWTVTSGQPVGSYQFTNANAYNSQFTGESGETYVLQWEAVNTSPCDNTTSTITVTFAHCANNLVFDGTNDYINCQDNYNMTGNFSLEAWIKADVLSGLKTILSKRNQTSLTNGFDLSINGANVIFRYNGSNVTALASLSTNKWYHIAVTYNGTQYIVYIDGFQVATQNGTAPTTNTNKFLIGAMDRTNNTPISYFDGSIDEVRIWNVALSQTQIQAMMNQEIQANGINVRGVVVPLDIAGLQWSNLRGYYQMAAGSQTVLASGTINDISGNGVSGKMVNMTTVQSETAPMPYISNSNNVWDNQNTWLNGAVQKLPNSAVDGITGLAQTWNIVRTQHNVTSGNRPTTLLGLLVDSNRYSITNNQRLDVTKYLRIDGTLDLVGESQLLQPDGSYVDYNGTGRLEIDQQGTGNKFNYNYWGSPVTTGGTTAVLSSAQNRTFALGSILYNPNNSNTAVAWVAGHSAATTTPLTLSSYWLYTFNGGNGNYSDWHSINQNTPVQAGFGYTMKGAGAVGSADQNYTFRGQPNTGTINHLIAGGNEILVGNPYPSAIDSHTFIDDNIGSFEDGSIKYWVQSPGNNSHVLAQYEGGYAYYTKLGGVPAVRPPGIAGVGTANAFIPKQYIPVGQGFFVSANAVGGNVIFNNNQRVFQKESNGNSIFLRSANAAESDSNTEEDLIQRIRLDVKSPANSVRHLLLGFTPDNAATDAFDYGYDAKNADNFPNDVAFMIDNDKYVIQGVGAFDDSKQYPLGIFLSNTGTVEISLADMENFDQPVDVFIYDAVLGTYTPINDLSFQVQLEAGNYTNRYYVVFQEDSTLDIIDKDFKDITVAYLNGTNEIYVKTPSHVQAKQVYLINILGQTVKSWNATNTSLSNEFKIPVRGISEGNYIVQIETNSGSYSKKIIVKY